MSLCTCTGPTNIIYKSHSKDAISMWPDMHSFYKIHTFEPIVIFLFSLRNVDHVLRFTNFTVSNCSSFYIFHKFGPILARICEIGKTTNQNDSRDQFLIRRFTEFTNSSQNRSEFVNLVKRWTIWNCEIGKTKHMINISKRK